MLSAQALEAQLNSIYEECEIGIDVPAFGFGVMFHTLLLTFADTTAAGPVVVFEHLQSSARTPDLKLPVHSIDKIALPSTKAPYWLDAIERL